MVRGMKRFVNQPFQMRGIAQENEVFGARKTLQEIGEAFAETMQVAVHRFVRCDEATAAWRKNSLPTRRSMTG